MDSREFDDILNEYNSRYQRCNLPDLGQFGVDPHNLNRGFTEGESSRLNPTDELNKNRGRLSADGAEDKVDSSVDHAVGFPPMNNQKQATPYKSSNQFWQGIPYTYDEFGQLEGNAGYEKEVIEHYLCKHHFYEERSKLKNSGLTLWIQRAPLITDSYGATPILCLYKDCHVDQNRCIQAGDIRIALDEKTARGLERDPRINAGYVHLKCLEAHVPYHRQMFTKLNFKVEGRGPHKNGPWLKNPTIFTTMSQIVYAEDYIERCSKESWNGGRTSDAILLSAGIEKELRGAHPAVREVESKILEMEGWGDLKALIDLKYAQASSTELTGKKIERPLQPRSKPNGANIISLEAYTKKEKDHRGRDGIWAAKEVKKRGGRRNGYESPQIKESRLKSSEHSKRRPKKRDSPPKEIELKVPTEPQPLKRGEGKIKTRLYIKDGKEVWEDFEDPWSPLVSDIEEDTEDNDEWRGDEDSGDDEASSGDEPKERKRMRSDDEDGLEDDEPRDDKRKRAY